jgi:hypothetical protein
MVLQLEQKKERIRHSKQTEAVSASLDAQRRACCTRKLHKKTLARVKIYVIIVFAGLKWWIARPELLLITTRRRLRRPQNSDHGSPPSHLVSVLTV